MADSYNKWERFYHRLNLIFNGIVAFSLIPFAFSFLETQKEYPGLPMLEGKAVMVFKITMIACSAVVIAVAQLFAKKSLGKVQKVKGINEKLSQYLNEKIKSFALLESAAILACVGLFVSKDQMFSFVYVFVLFIFSLGRPTFERVAREVGVPEKDLKSWGEQTGD